MAINTVLWHILFEFLENGLNLGLVKVSLFFSHPDLLKMINQA